MPPMSSLQKAKLEREKDNPTRKVSAMEAK
jgi:hypothetical protein